MIFLRTETILGNIDGFANIFLWVKWLVLLDLWNFRTGRELSLISSFCIYWKRKLRKVHNLGKGFQSDIWWRSGISSPPSIVTPLSLEASSHILQWCSVLQTMGELKVKFDWLVILFSAIMALNILCNLSIYNSDSLLWSWFNSGNRKKKRC